jgi:hypothetical protein
MNLSSYLQMPPAPLVPTSTSNAAPQAARPGAGPSAGANLGFDFSQIMARQLERLVPLERQTIAADAAQPQEQAARNQDSRQTTERRDTREGVERETRETRETCANDDASQDDAGDTSATQAKPRNKNTAAKHSQTDVDALLEGLMQGAPMVPSDQVTSGNAAGATDTPSTGVADVAAATGNATDTSTPVSHAASLQTIELSPQVRIITDANKAPSPESLAAFAKSMGLDESTIQNLMSQPPGSALGAAATTAAGLPNGLTWRRPMTCKQP